MLSRRNLLSSGLALSASSIAARSAWARAAALLSDHPAAIPSAIAPREHLLFDFGWKFRFGHANDPARDLNFSRTRGAWESPEGDFAKTGDFWFAKGKFDDSSWRTITLPHDWSVELPFVRDEDLRMHGYKPLGRNYPETSIGWYRRAFEIPQSDAGRRITVAFDGAFRSVLVFVNGCYIGRNDNGYVPFHFDISDFLAYGQKNYIALRVDASYGDGWYYEGAGVYRHVWLTKTDPLHLARCGSTVRTSIVGNSATLALATVVQNESNQPVAAKVAWQIIDAAGKTVATADTSLQPIEAGGSAAFSASAKIASPSLWSVEMPNLYSAVVTVTTAGTPRDVEQIRFGIRTVRFDPDHGLFVNDKPIKIQGTCNHQDHAGVGAAMPDALQWFRLGVLKEMGCNAVRTSHNFPTPELVEGCDRMGLMMMCETRQMSSSMEGLAQLETMVKRYRNSPCVIFWSIGNEEWVLQSEEAEQGARIAETMVRRCHQLDPTRAVSAAVNDTNEKGPSDALDIIGFNYNLNYPDGFHQRHPKRSIYGSETSCALSTRGEYTTVPERNTVSSYDVNIPSFGEHAEEWWKFYATREWEAGGFAWTGFDYRGEPVPYGWPSINSQVGISDLCGFPKDIYYYYRAWWRTDPVLHLFPHWNFEGREGDEIPVWVYSNLEEVELIVNEKSAGRQRVPHLGHVEWKVRYEPGSIEARAYKAGKLALTEKRETTGAATSLRLTPGRAEIDADGEDLAILKVEALDKQGRPVPTANLLIGFKVSGEGVLMGVGNGDPNCLESDKEPRRSLFNGLAQVIVQSTKTAGEIHIAAAREGSDGPEMTPAKLIIRTKEVTPRAAVIS
jgi:beta-galactosidase